MSSRTTIQAFVDPKTWTVTYVVWDPATRRAAVIDPVLDYELNHRDSLSLPREKRALTVAAERREALKAKQRLVAKAKAAKAALSGLAGKCFHGDVGRTAEFAESKVGLLE